MNGRYLETKGSQLLPNKTGIKRKRKELLARVARVFHREYCADIRFDKSAALSFVRTIVESRCNDRDKVAGHSAGLS